MNKTCIYKNIPYKYGDVICGTFKKALAEDDTVTWEETKGFNPTYIGGLVISLKPNSVWVDVKVSE